MKHYLKQILNADSTETLNRLQFSIAMDDKINYSEYHALMVVLKEKHKKLKQIEKICRNRIIHERIINNLNEMINIKI